MLHRLVQLHVGHLLAGRRLPHLVERLRLRRGFDIVHVRYSSAGQAFAAALGGQVVIDFSGAPPQPQASQRTMVRSLAVTGSTRFKELASKPAIAEAGHANIDSEGDSASSCQGQGLRRWLQRCTAGCCDS